MDQIPSHRERHLLQLAQALEDHLEEGWYFALFIAKPKETNSVSVVSNILDADEFIELLQEVIHRHAERTCQP